MAQQFVRGHFDPRWQTDTTQTNISLRELKSLLPRDGFQVISNPKFVDKEGWQAYYFRFEPVIALSVDGTQKAYPLNVLTFHEIANDVIANIPIAVTYCPLCNAGVVYDRRLNLRGKTYVLDLAVSGMLRKSDMVMWDKQTETWWQQLTGEGLVGTLQGQQLNVLVSQIISVEEFFDSYPEGQIMVSPVKENYDGEYGTNPYVKYDSLGNQGSKFFDGPPDSRLPAMERLIDVENGGKYKVYPFSSIKRKRVINDDFEGKHLVIFYTAKTVSVLDAALIKDARHVGTATVFSSVVDGKTMIFKRKRGKFIDHATGSVWDITGKCVEGALKGKQLVTEPHSNHFAFAWLAFYPDSKIYR